MAISVYPSETPVGSYNADTCDRLREFQLINYLHTLKQARLTSFRTYGGTVSVGNGLAASVALGYWVIYGRVVYSSGAASITGLTAAATNYLWLALDFTGALVTGATFTSNTSGTPPAYSVCVGKAVTLQRTISSLTRASNVVTVTTSTAHTKATNDYVTVAGTSGASADGTVQITVTGSTTFTYASSGADGTWTAGTVGWTSTVSDVTANPGFAEGTYTGNASDPQTIFLGFQPAVVEVAGYGTNGYMLAKSSPPVRIDAVEVLVNSGQRPGAATLGFTVSGDLNTNGFTYWYSVHS